MRPSPPLVATLALLAVGATGCFGRARSQPASALRAPTWEQAAAHCAQRTHISKAAVRVPGVRSAVLGAAYRMLAAAGLRVAIPPGFGVSSLQEPAVREQRPAGGTHVPPGTTVTLTLGWNPLGSPATTDAKAVVPNFVGRPACEGTIWAESHRQFWQVRALPALRGGKAETLLGAYRVVSQTPAPGTILRQGYRRHGAFHLTPLSLVVVPRR